MKEFNRILGILAIATVGLYLLLAGMAVFLYIDAQHERQALRGRVDEATKNTIALCAFKADIKARIVEDRKSLKRTQRIVSEIRSGKRPQIPGLSDRDLQESLDADERVIARQRRTVRSLHARDCP